jgi:regulator of RNase E activity RraA
MDPFALAQRYTYLRLADVSDALDALGLQDLFLLSPEVRPLWAGMKFWGVALTVRVVPARRHMPPLAKADALRSHGIWFQQHGRPQYSQLIQPGHVVVMEAHECRETGIWGSANSMGAVASGAAGIVTDGYARDTYELTLQKTPICCRQRGRTIIPGRVEFVDQQVPINCGGVQVRPGDIVGCDDDGVIVVPQEAAAEVVPIAAAILLDDMRSRRRLYERLGMPPDRTVAVDEAEAFYKDLL